jgi:hypothetical protein
MASFLPKEIRLSHGTLFVVIAILTTQSLTPNTTFMTEQQKLALEQAIAALKGKLTGNMFSDMETRDQIHNLEMQLKGVKPIDSFIDCVGCGS